MKKWVGLIAGACLIVLLVALGFLYFHNDPKAEFHKFLAAQAAKNEIALEGTFSDDKSEVKLKYLFNSSKRNILIYRSAQCKSVFNNNPIYLSASVYAINGKQYIRLEEARGIIQQSGSPARDLQKVFAKVKGNWYLVPLSDAAVESAKDYGTLVIDSGLVNPSNKAKFADLLINNNAMQLKASKQDSSGRNFEVINNRTGWTEVFREIYGEKRIETEQTRSMFGSKKQKPTQIIGATNGGDFKSISTTNQNYCIDLFGAFMAIKPTDQASQLPGSYIMIDPNSVQQQNIVNSKPLVDLARDLQL